MLLYGCHPIVGIMQLLIFMDESIKIQLLHYGINVKYFDLNKAFDSIPYQRVLNKLEA